MTELPDALVVLTVTDVVRFTVVVLFCERDIIGIVQPMHISLQWYSNVPASM